MARRRYTTLKIREVSGVDVPAQEPALVAAIKRGDATATPERVRAPLIGSRPVPVSTSKATAITDGEGHSHLICDIDERSAGETSSAPTDGQEYGWHSHPWIRGTDGAITIGIAAGHSHAIVASTDGVARMTATTTTTEDAGDAGEMIDTSKGAQRAQKGSDTMAMTPEETARLQRAEALATMTDAHKRHHAKLSPAEAEAFRALTPAGRDAAIAADPVIYTAKSGALRGREFRASDELADPDKLALIRSLDAAEERAIEANKRAIAADVAKRAGDLVALGGTDVNRQAIVAALDTIADPAERDAAHRILKGATAAMRQLGATLGTTENPTGDPESPTEAFDRGLAEFATATKRAPAEAISDFMATDAGRALYTAAYV